MRVDLKYGSVVLLASFCVLFTLPTIHGADFLKDLLACKKAGLPINCDLPVPTTTVPAASPPSPGTPPPPASPPGSPPLPPSPPPSPTVSPPVISSAPSPGPEQAAPVPAPMPDTIAPAPAPSDSAPAPAPSDFAPAPSPLLLAPAPAPQTPPQGPITQVILAGGQSARDRSSIYDVATGIWGDGPDMTAPRRFFPMIRISPTEVLAAGGEDTGSAEIFSTVTQKWQATPPMKAIRIFNSMVLLPDGSAFTAGGSKVNSDTVFKSTELYTQGQWSDGPSMGTARADFTMLTYVVNSETRVLACGGQEDDSGSPTASCEEWSPGRSPASGFEYLSSSLLVPVANYRAVLLNGRPFITGGLTANAAGTNAAQLLVNGAWTSATSMQQARSGHAMVVLQNGEALVCGGSGSDGTRLSSCEKFNGQSWVYSASLPARQQNFNMLVLPNGDVLFTGMTQQPPNSPISATWTPGAQNWVTIPSSVNIVPADASGLAGV